MKNVVYRSFKAHLSNDDNYVEGYASTYGNIDKVNDVVTPGAFTKSLDMKQRSAPVRFLWQHNPDRPIGVIEQLEDRPKGLWFRARFANTTDGQDAREAFKSGTIDRFSIGYQVMQREREKREGRMVNLLKEIKLFEISAVTFPANEQAMMTAVKSALSGELSEENRALLVQLANMMIAAQGGSTQSAPEEPVVGETGLESTEDAVEGEEAAQDAPEGEEQAPDAQTEQDDAETAPADEEKPKKPADEEEDDEEERAKKGVEALRAYLNERALREYLAQRKRA